MGFADNRLNRLITSTKRKEVSVYVEVFYYKVRRRDRDNPVMPRV